MAGRQLVGSTGGVATVQEHPRIGVWRSHASLQGECEGSPSAEAADAICHGLRPAPPPAESGVPAHNIDSPPSPWPLLCFSCLQGISALQFRAGSARSLPVQAVGRRISPVGPPAPATSSGRGELPATAAPVLPRSPLPPSLGLQPRPQMLLPGSIRLLSNVVALPRERLVQLRRAAADLLRLPQQQSQRQGDAAAQLQQPVQEQAAAGEAPLSAEALQLVLL